MTSLISLALAFQACVTSDPSPTAKPDVAVSEDVGVEPDVVSPIDVVEVPSLDIPYPLLELPDGATAPWPGGVVHGALLKVAHVIDGDTLYLEVAEGSAVRLRIVGIDAPECIKRRVTSSWMECDPANTDFSGDGEPFGVESWQALKALIDADPVVRIACNMVDGFCDRDHFDRYLGWLITSGPLDASVHLASNGLALTYTAFPVPNMNVYCAAEDEAIAAKRGLWSEGFDAAFAGFNPSTRTWYSSRNSRCQAAQKQ
ncbi:MAG: thermonuclease family protein [Bradymonadaceae bacterium]|nr:thermonuclease family protein [Lujinxingiaceae bacterium]